MLVPFKDRRAVSEIQNVVLGNIVSWYNYYEQKLYGAVQPVIQKQQMEN